MATSLPSVVVPSDSWVDLYAETGISVGTQLIVQNLGDYNARLVESSVKPTMNSGYNTITPKSFLTSGSSPVGSWAYASGGVLLQVEEA